MTYSDARRSRATSQGSRAHDAEIVCSLSMSIPRTILTLISALVLSGCSVASQRVALPIPAEKSALVNGVADIRFRGDVLTRAVENVVHSQYQQILQTQPRAGRDERTATVDFLAISGGGADGAFAAGFLEGWSRSGTRPSFEVVTGVSTGALVAPFAFLGSSYDRTLKAIYTGISDDDVYRSQGLFGLLGESLLDPSPLRTRIEQLLTEAFLDRIAAEYELGRRLLIQTADVERQVPIIWDLTKIAARDRSNRRALITDILLASASIPGLFPPVRIKTNIDGQMIEELHVDGGITAQIFFAPPGLDLPRFETRYFGKPRTQRLHLIRNGKLVAETEATEPQALPLVNRAVSTLIKYQSIQDVSRIRRAFEQNGSNLSIAAIPSTFQIKPKSLFDQNYMIALYANGYAIGRGPNRWKATGELAAEPDRRQ